MKNFNKLKRFSYLVLFFVIISLGLIACGNDKTASEEWKYIGEIRDEKGKYVSVYIDLNNIQIEDNIRKFWIRYVAPKGNEDNEETYIRQLGYWEVDCQDRTLHVLGEEYYGPEGQVLGRSEVRKKEEYKDNSIGSKMSSAACRYAGRN